MSGMFFLRHTVVVVVVVVVVIFNKTVDGGFHVCGERKSLSRAQGKDPV